MIDKKAVNEAAFRIHWAWLALSQDMQPTPGSAFEAEMREMEESVDGLLKLIEENPRRK